MQKKQKAVPPAVVASARLTQTALTRTSLVDLIKNHQAAQIIADVNTVVSGSKR